MYRTIPAYYESNTTKVLSYSILEEAERRFNFREEIKQFIERAEQDYVKTLADALRQAAETTVTSFYPQFFNASGKLPLPNEGLPFQLFTMEVLLDKDVIGHVRDFYPATPDDQDLLADALNLVGVKYGMVGDDGKSILGQRSKNDGDLTIKEIIDAAVSRARDEETRAAKFGFDRLELEYKSE